MTKVYDVVVVGAGPAGLMAAKTAGENGLSVALLERKEQVTNINRACTMMVLVLNEYKRQWAHALPLERFQI